MIGLSLSFCVQDIIEGRAALEDVEKIIASTRAETPEDWDNLISCYQEYYWRHNPDEGERICRLLLAEGRIEQPRVEGREPHNIAGGHWISDGNEPDRGPCTR
jgi:hypothetical protein